MSNPLISRTHADGESIMIALPAEVVRRLGIVAGQELQWIEDGPGAYRVVPCTPEVAKAMDAHEAVIAEYDAVFRRLAE